jgi:hypothetical protein
MWPPFFDSVSKDWLVRFVEHRIGGCSLNDFVLERHHRQRALFSICLWYVRSARW